MLLNIISYFLFAGLANGTIYEYEKLESKIQKFTHQYNIVFAGAVFASMVMMPSLVAFYNSFNGLYGLDAWYLPLVTM